MHRAPLVTVRRSTPVGVRLRPVPAAARLGLRVPAALPPHARVVHLQPLPA